MFDTNSKDDSCAEEIICLGGEFDKKHADDAKRRVVRKQLADNYKRYRAMAVRRLRDDADADDVVQAFALKALERVEQLRDVRAVHGWLRRLFETALIDFCRRRSTRSKHEVSFDIELHDCPHDALTDTTPDPVGSTLTLLTLIKKEYADTICRLDLLDQPKEEAARELGITINNLTVRAHRARRALRDTLESMPISMTGFSASPGRALTAPAFEMACA